MIYNSVEAAIDSSIVTMTETLCRKSVENVMQLLDDCDDYVQYVDKHNNIITTYIGETFDGCKWTVTVGIERGSQ
jgi:hypothetical protein